MTGPLRGNKVYQHATMSVSLAQRNAIVTTLSEKLKLIYEQKATHINFTFHADSKVLTPDDMKFFRKLLGAVEDKLTSETSSHMCDWTWRNYDDVPNPTDDDDPTVSGFNIQVWPRHPNPIRLLEASSIALSFTA